MPNILNGIDKMNKQQLQSLLATLETTNLTNSMGEYGQKVHKKTVKAFNSIMKKINKKPITEPKVVTLEERLDNKIVELNQYDEQALRKQMREVLLSKAGYNSLSVVSDDELSTDVINIAVRCFKNEISDQLTPSQKADAIFNRYTERLIVQTQKAYREASDEQKNEINRKFNDEINSMSQSEREELQKALGVDNITEKTISNMLKTTAGTVAFIMAVETSGMGAYIALTTIMHAVFTTTLGIALPFAAYTTSTSILAFLAGPGGLIIFAGIEALMIMKNHNKIIAELFAQVVWYAVLCMGGRFTPKDETLPNWLPEDLRQNAINDSNELLAMVKKCENLVSSYNQIKNELEKNRLNIRLKEQKIDELADMVKNLRNHSVSVCKENDMLSKNLENAEFRLKQTEKMLHLKENDLYEINKIKTEYEQGQLKISVNNQEIVKLKQQIENYTKQFALYERDIAKLKTENKKLEDSCTQSLQTINSLQTICNEKTEKQCKRIALRWDKSYRKFLFDNGVIKYIVKHFSYNELGDIERALMELHQADNPLAIASNRGKMYCTDEYHLGFSICNIPARIFYKKESGLPNGKTIHITYICKHNDSRYGKR